MEFLQSTVNGALSTDYTLHISFGIIGVLLVGIAGMVGKHFISALTKIETKLDKHEGEIQELKTDTELIRANIGHINQNLANDIVAKLKAISPR